MAFENEEEIKAERAKWNLTEDEYQENFNSIFSELVLTGRATSSENPTFIMVGGQAGCGKSILVGKELGELKNGAIVIDQDILRTKHPNYKKIHDTYTEREEFLLLKRYLDRIVNDTVEKSSEEGYNLILESALRSVSKFIKNTEYMKQKGYNTKLSVLAVSPDEANLSMFTRYCIFLKNEGECRRNTRVDNDSVDKIPLNIEKMDELGIFDDITISIRGKKEDSFLPSQVYSRKETPSISPASAYISIVSSQKTKVEDFKKRYLNLREILKSYNQEVQIERLDEFHKDFILRNRESNEYPDFDE